MTSSRKLSATNVAALAVFGLSLLGIWFARPLESLLEIAENAAGTTWLLQLFSTLAVLAGAQLVNRLIDAVIWDRLVSRALGGKVPAILKTMVSVVVFLCYGPFLRSLPMSLEQVAIGSTARVADVSGSDSTSLRLLEMGLTPGVNVRVVGTAPLGGPMELELRGYRLSIRRHEAARVAIAK